MRKFVVEKLVQDLAVVQPAAGSQVAHVIVAKQLVGVMIGEFDDGGTMAGTERPKFLVVGTSSRVRDPKLVIPGTMQRHAQEQRTGTELGQLTQKQIQVEPFLAGLE